MQYTIENDETLGICIVRVSGENRRPDDSKVLQKVANDIRSKSGCTRFLYDMQQANIIGSTMDTFFTGIEPFKKQFERDFRIALVYSGSMDDHKFMEDVVVNRGYTLRVFSDIEEATSWIVKQLPNN